MIEQSTKHRRSVRLAGYDYRQGGAYFVTICAAGRVCSLGQIRDGLVVPSQSGEIAQAAWEAIPAHYGHVSLDAFVMMPNHLHGILLFAASVEGADGRGTTYRAPTTERQFGVTQRGSLADVIGKFKAAVTREINRANGATAISFWQRNYYEHIVRNKDGLNRIRQYLADNPARWADDELYAAG